MPKSHRAMTIFPFVFLKNNKLREDKVLLNHERIHLRQQLECLIVLFYVIYLVEFLIHFLRKRSRIEAYRRISFEREAFRNEKDFHYIAGRKPWYWVRYL